MFYFRCVLSPSYHCGIFCSEHRMKRGRCEHDLHHIILRICFPVFLPNKHRQDHLWGAISFFFRKVVLRDVEELAHGGRRFSLQNCIGLTSNAILLDFSSFYFIFLFDMNMIDSINILTQSSFVASKTGFFSNNGSVTVDVTKGIFPFIYQCVSICAVDTDCVFII